MPARGAALAVALAAVAAAGCAPAAPAPSGPAATGASPPIGVPAALFARPHDLAVSVPGDPSARRTVRLPPGSWRPTAAIGPGSTLLLVGDPGADRPLALVGHVAGDAVDEAWRLALPPDAAGDLAPGCVAGPERAVVIGAALLALGRGGVRARLARPATLGRCQMPDPATVLYLAEDDHAVVEWSLDSGEAARRSAWCDDLSAADGLLACLAVGGASVAVGPWPARPGGVGHSAPATPPPVTLPLTAAAGQVLLAPGGTWLAVVAIGGSTVRLFRRMGDGGYEADGLVTLAGGESLLGFLGP